MIKLDEKLVGLYPWNEGGQINDSNAEVKLNKESVNINELITKDNNIDTDNKKEVLEHNYELDDLFWYLDINIILAWY